MLHTYGLVVVFASTAAAGGEVQGQASYNDFCREREERKKNQAKTELSIKNMFSPQKLLIYLMK